MKIKRGDYEFSERQLDILPLVAEGLMNAEIGKRLFISTACVRDHMTILMNTFGARNRTHVVAIALRSGVIE